MEYSIFGDAKISVWMNGHDTTASRNIDLAVWIRSTVEGHPKHQATITTIRETSDDDERRHLKANFLPACTPSGTWKDRKAETVVPESLNGWVQFDIDGIDDTSKAAELRNALSKIPEIGFCGLSVSGGNLWGLVKVKYPDKADQHFQQLREDFNRFGIRIDSVGKPKQLRFYSYDPDAYIAQSVTEYERLPKPKAAPKAGYIDRNIQDKYGEVMQALDVIRQTGTDIAGDHGEYLKLGMGIANEFGEAGREIMHAICRHWYRYSENPAKHHATVEQDYTYFLRYPDKRCDITVFWCLFHRAGLKLSKQANTVAHNPVVYYRPLVPQKSAKPQVKDEDAAFDELISYFEARRIEFSDKVRAHAHAREGDDNAAEIRELESFFQTCTYPAVQVTIDGFEVEDWKKFANAHISFLSTSIREAYKQPYLHRLRRLRAILEAYGDKAQAV
jgi:hypothetical protein